MLLRGAKKHECPYFNLGMLRIQGGIKNSPQTQSEMRRIKFLFWHYSMQIIPFWCLSYLNFGIFERNSTFSYANIKFYLFVLGGSPPSICSNFKNVLICANWVRGIILNIFQRCLKFQNVLIIRAFSK